MKQIIIILLILGISPSFCLELGDLEDASNLSDFVIEAKQINIPEYPFATNPSLIKINNNYLMCFSFHAPTNSKEFKYDVISGIVELDDNFKPICPAHPLLPLNKKTKLLRAYDGRLVAIGDKIYIVYSDFKYFGKTRSRRVFIAEIVKIDTSYFLDNPKYLYDIETEFHGATQEKNWIPFEWENDLLLIYSPTPHRILHYDFNQKGTCTPIASTQVDFPWQWGTVRGGTQTIQLEDGNYLSIFHSMTYASSLQSNHEEMRHYFMGAYIFEGKPPFKILKHSPAPVIGKNFYNGKVDYTSWIPLRVVYPAGITADEQYVFVTYGRQDNECWVAKLDKDKLLASMIIIDDSNLAIKK